jgi:hypothetical protein
LGKIVNIYRFPLNFWAVKADIEREGGLSVSLSNVVLTARSPLFVQYRSIISEPGFDFHEGTSIRAGSFCQATDPN